MKNSIGSLAALAAFAAPALAAPPPPPVAASFHHVPVSLNDPEVIAFNIDGDLTDDFYVFGNANRLYIGVYGGVSYSANIAHGAFFDDSNATATWGTHLLANQTAYYGFSILRDGDTHAAWVLFDTNSANPLIVGGGWQTMSGAPVLVGSPTPVPEPASFAALAGLGALVGAVVSRRRRAAPPATSA